MTKPEKPEGALLLLSKGWDQRAVLQMLKRFLPANYDLRTPNMVSLQRAARPGEEIVRIVKKGETSLEVEAALIVRRDAKPDLFKLSYSDKLVEVSNLVRILDSALSEREKICGHVYVSSQQRTP